MHHESILLLAKSLAAGMGLVTVATVDRLVPIIMGQAAAADITSWSKIIAEYGVLVALAIYFLWRDWIREQRSILDKKEASDKAHELNIASIEATKQRDKQQFDSRQRREEQAHQQWIHSEHQRERLTHDLMKLADFVIRLHPDYTPPESISDSSSRKFIQSDKHPT